MTKQKEIQALWEFIVTIPETSYIRPMLTSAMPMITSDINADMPTNLPTWMSSLRREKAQLEAENKELYEKGLALENKNKEAQQQFNRLADGIDTLKNTIAKMRNKLTDLL